MLPVIAAGLIDGINPCAFTTLIFLLASLALAGRGRREVLVIGALFSLAVFLSYFLIGLGLFAALRAATAISLVSVLLRWALVGVLFVFAGLSVYDYALIRAGRPTEMLLQLPSSFKKRIHASIRTRVRIAAIAGSSLVLGFLVSVFEFACTGQVYLPLLGYLARMHRQLDALGLLAPVQPLLHPSPPDRLRRELPGRQLGQDHHGVPGAHGEGEAGPRGRLRRTGGVHPCRVTRLRLC